MAAVRSIDSTSLFRILDRLFWLVWAAFPLMIWLHYQNVMDLEAVAAALPADRRACIDLMPDPGRMSMAGQLIFWCLFTFQLSIYAVLLAPLHLIIHRFKTGRIFVSQTLTTLNWLGIVLIVWPFLDVAVTNFAAARLHAIGDLPVYVPGYVIDVAPIAVGLFLIALRFMLERAIALQAEHDLTI